MKAIERVKGAQRKILVKSSKPGNKAQRKVEYKNYDAITMSRNYEEKLLQEIITGMGYERHLMFLIVQGGKCISIIKYILSNH